MQENQILNEEINNENFNVDILKNDIKALKIELNSTHENIHNVRHLILKQTKENENLKKSIIKKVFYNH